MVFFVFLGLYMRHMEVPRLGLQLELQLPAYAMATAIPDPSCICDLHHGSQQHWILNPLNKAGDGTRNLIVPSWILFHCAMMGTPRFFFFFFFLFTAALVAYGSSQARGRIRASATGLHHSHSSTRSKPHLQLGLQLAAMLDP